MSYDEQLSAARFRAERDQARQECDRLRARLRDSVPREAYERKRATWLRHIRECEAALRKRRECIKRLESAALERRTVREEDREAAEWVRGHGGIEDLRRMFQDADSRRVELCGALGIDLDKGWSEAMAAMRLRLMPEGMEWPRYESGELVLFGDEFINAKGNASTLRTIAIEDCRDALGGAVFWKLGKGACAVTLENGERVKRPAPKVLDADGVEIRVGDALYYTATGCKATVRGINPDGTIELDGHENRGWRADLFAHRAPVLAADGRPLEVGQTVWHVGNGVEFTVIGLPKSVEYQAVKLRLDDGAVTGLDTDQLTHQRPVLDADGVPIHEGDTVYDKDTGDRFEVDVFTHAGVVCTDIDACESDIEILPSQLTHTKPEIDTWERLEEDAGKDPCGYFGFDEEETCGKCPASGKNCEQTMARDFVRRAKKLAGVGE